MITTNKHNTNNNIPSRAGRRRHPRRPPLHTAAAQRARGLLVGAGLALRVQHARGRGRARRVDPEYAGALQAARLERLIRGRQLG
jgi:hypothetical protein